MASTPGILDCDESSPSTQPRRRLSHVTKHRNRSKTGCTVCRAKKVKCDEQRPQCRRCGRLGLPCTWTDHRQSSARARLTAARGNRPPRELCPRESSRHSTPVHTDLPATTQDGPAPDLSEAALDMPAIWSEYDQSAPSFVPGTLPSVTSINPEESSTQQGGALAAQHAAGFSWEEFCVPWSTMGDFEWNFPTALGCSPFSVDGTQASASTLESPPFPLSPLDVRALNHYSTTFSLSFTSKNPKWSTLSVARRLAMSDAMVLHCLLAVSFYDLWTRKGQRDQDLQDAALHHSEAGSNLLASRNDAALRSNSIVTPLDHARILSSYWFLYMLKARWRDIDAESLCQMSSAITQHIHFYQLDDLCGSPTPLYQTVAEQASGDNHSIIPTIPDASNMSTACSAREGSLLALLMICLYYQDIKCGFYNTGGKLAAYLNSDKAKLGHIYDLCRTALALQWGDSYPVHELVQDLDNYTTLKLQSELNILVEDMNCEFPSTRHDPGVEATFQSRLDSLQSQYANIFSMVTAKPSSASLSIRGREPEPRRQDINQKLSVAYHHAVRVYLFRCTAENPAVQEPQAVQASLEQVLRIARQVLPDTSEYSTAAEDGARSTPALLHRLEWPLFITGVEVKDEFYQDWILYNIRSGNIGRALRYVLKKQQDLGQRLGIEHVREAFTRT